MPPDGPRFPRASRPLYEVKAQLFKSIGHPSRIRILEILSDGERSVTDLLPMVGLEASHLSQQLGVLRGAGLVQARKVGTTVFYRLSHPLATELLSVARRLLRDLVSEQAELLDDLPETPTPAPEAATAVRQPRSPNHT